MIIDLQWLTSIFIIKKKILIVYRMLIVYKRMISAKYRSKYFCIILFLYKPVTLLVKFIRKCVHNDVSHTYSECLCQQMQWSTLKYLLFSLLLRTIKHSFIKCKLLCDDTI